MPRKYHRKRQMPESTAPDFSMPAEKERVLREVTRGLASGRDSTELMQRLLASSARIADADAAFLERAYPDVVEVEVVAATGEPVPPIGRRVPYPGSMAEEVLDRGRPELLDSSTLGKRVMRDELGGICDGCSGLVLPLLSDGEAIGALILIRLAGKAPFRLEDANPLVPLTDLAALAINQSLLREESERRQEALLESERRFRLLVSAVQDHALFMLTPQGAVATWNEGAERITGYAESEIVGKPFQLFYTPEDRLTDRPEESLAAAATEGSCTSEVAQQRKDESRFWAQIVIRPIRSGEGKLLGFAVVLRDLTELGEMREAQALERARYRLLYDRNPNIFTTTDEYGTIISANAFGAEYLGFTPAELVGRSTFELVWPDDVPAVREHHARCVANPDHTHQLQFRKVRRDGTPLWVRENAVAAHGVSGKLIVLSTCDDITPRIEAEAALRRSEEQLRQLTENLREVLWVAEPDFGRFTYISPAFETVWGSPREEVYLSSESFLAPIDGDRREEVRRALHRMREESVEVEFPIRRPDGERRIISIRGFPVHCADGEVQRIVGISEDITEWQKLEDRRNILVEAGRVLGSSLEYEATLQNVAALAVEYLADWCLVDLHEDGVIRRVVVAHADPAVVEVARDYLESLPATVTSTTALERAIATGESQVVLPGDDRLLDSLTLENADAAVIRQFSLASGVSHPLKTHGRVLGAITFLVSPDRPALDAEDVHTAELLTDRAGLAIDKAQLYRKAQEATSLRDDVLGIVSHDLRNPLNTIMLSAGFLRDLAPAEDPGTIKQLNIIKRSADQMNRLIQDLLDVAQIEAGGISVEPEPREVGSLIKEACRSFQPLAEARGIDLRCSLSGQLPRINFDWDRLLQVFSNLIGNAVKFTPEGGEVLVRAETSGTCVRFSVIDNGKGIEPEDLPHLFDRFYQSRKSRKGGAGLGLAIVKGIVEAHNGRVEVRSVVGQGSAFTFELPGVGS
jgi:PAS domain S-box-containing protein